VEVWQVGLGEEKRQKKKKIDRNYRAKK